MNAIHHLTIVKRGIVVYVNIWGNDEDRRYTYNIVVNGKGFQVDKKTQEKDPNSPVEVDVTLRDEKIVDYESFIDPTAISEVEIEALAMFVPYWNKYDQIVTILASKLMVCWNESWGEAQVEVFLRDELKAFEGM